MAPRLIRLPQLTLPQELYPAQNRDLARSPLEHMHKSSSQQTLTDDNQIKSQQSPTTTATHSRAHFADGAFSAYQSNEVGTSTGQLPIPSCEIFQTTFSAFCSNPGPWGADLEKFDELRRKRNDPVNPYFPVNSSAGGFSLKNPGRWGKDLEYFDKHMRANGHHTTGSSLSSTWDQMDSDE
jgi:hypothetical protein